jgi:hypothetical protein
MAELLRDNPAAASSTAPTLKRRRKAIAPKARTNNVVRLADYREGAA